jgi:hypothetical protein
MDRPVGAPGLAELARTIQWIDNPYPVGPQTRLVVDALLRQDCVVRPGRREFGHEEFVRPLVSGVAQSVGVAALGAQVEEQLACALGKIGGKRMVVGYTHATANDA